MRALVTGGGGFLGGAIARRLLARGVEVRTFNRQPAPELTALGIEHVRGDLDSREQLCAAARGCEVAFHAAAKAGIWGSRADYYRTNVTGTENMIHACRAEGVRSLVYTSSPSVVFAGGDQEGINEAIPYARRFLSPYPWSKALAERMVLAANGNELATVALRPHLIWGPHDPHLVPRLLERARRGHLVFIGRKPHLVDSVFIDNAADAHLCAAERLTRGSAPAGKAYFITQGEPIPVQALINRILGAARLPPASRSVPMPVAYAAGMTCEWIYALLRVKSEPPMTRFLARQLGRAHWFDISAARRDLGYEPRVTIDEGIARLAAWLDEEARVREARPRDTLVKERK